MVGAPTGVVLSLGLGRLTGLWMDRNLAIGASIALAAGLAFALWVQSLPVAQRWLQPDSPPALARAVDVPVQLPPQRVVPPQRHEPPVVPALAQLQPPPPAPAATPRPPHPVRPAPPPAAQPAPPQLATDSNGSVPVAVPNRAAAAGTGDVRGTGAGAATPSPGSADASGTAGQGETVYGAAAVDKLPIALDQPSPLYPEWARRQGATAVLLLRFVVGADGRVRDLQVRVTQGEPRLAGPVRDAAARWRFTPAQRGGKPVAVRVEQELRFDLEAEL